MSIEIGDGGLGYIYLGDVLIAGKGGGESGWKPNAHTVAYYPLTSSTTVNDMSGNNKNLTNVNATFGTYNGVDCANFGGSARLWNNTVTTSYIGQTSTMSVWVTRATGSSTEFWVGTANNGGNYSKHVSLSVSLQSAKVRYGCGGSGGWHDLDYTISTEANKWYHIVQTFESDGTRKCYLNGSLVGSGSQMIDLDSSWFSIGASQFYSSEIYYGKGTASEIIIENKAWSATDVSDYYNQTKSNYGL